MNKQQQMQDILKETVDYYNEDPVNRRSITEDGDCMYTWGKQHCAVGRFLKEEYQDETWDGNNDSVNELCEHNENYGGFDIDWCLVDRAQGLDADFWTRLQNIHDTVGYWKKRGLTDRGKEEYVQFQDKIAEGEYDD